MQYIYVCPHLKKLFFSSVLLIQIYFGMNYFAVSPSIRFSWMMFFFVDRKIEFLSSRVKCYVWKRAGNVFDRFFISEFTILSSPIISKFIKMHLHQATRKASPSPVNQYFHHIYFFFVTMNSAWQLYLSMFFPILQLSPIDIVEHFSSTWSIVRQKRSVRMRHK